MVGRVEVAQSPFVVRNERSMKGRSKEDRFLGISAQPQFLDSKRLPTPKVHYPPNCQ